MKHYDVIVIGAGDSGAGVTFRALSSGAKVALVEKGRIGGTCLNVGCVPSKTLIQVADTVMCVRDAHRLGVDAEIKRINFGAIMERMRKVVREGSGSLEEALRGSENLDIYSGTASFTGDMTIEVAGEKIKGEKIFIASGARPLVPPIRGLGTMNYLTNESLLGLTERPGSMVIIGGGYIGVEYAHFFSAMGTKVTLLQRSPRLVPQEEPEISDLLKDGLSKRMEVITGATVEEVEKGGKTITVSVSETAESVTKKIVADSLMVAAGRVSNADVLRPEATGVELTGAGFIRVNDYLETTRENIWALGDATGRQMFTHAGDKEAEIVWKNASGGSREKMDFGAVPHAVFTWPQIASVGLTEEEARKNFSISVGKARYLDTVKGSAMMEESGFAKAIIEKETGLILGFHIIGPEASILIQEVVNAFGGGGDRDSIIRHMHIFPALSDVIVEALNNAE